MRRDPRREARTCTCAVLCYSILYRVLYGVQAECVRFRFATRAIVRTARPEGFASISVALPNLFLKSRLELKDKPTACLRRIFPLPSAPHSELIHHEPFNFQPFHFTYASSQIRLHGRAPGCLSIQQVATSFQNVAPRLACSMILTANSHPGPHSIGTHLQLLFHEL